METDNSLTWPGVAWRHKTKLHLEEKKHNSKQVLMKPLSTQKASMQENQVRQLWLQLGMIISWKSLNPLSGGYKLRQCIRQDG